MKKNIAITVLIIVAALFMMFAFVQKAESDGDFKRAEDQRLVAEKNAIKAVEAMKIAEQETKIAAEAMRALEECKGTKKIE